MKTLLCSALLAGVLATGSLPAGSSVGLRERMLSFILYQPFNDFVMTTREAKVRAEDIRLTTEDGVVIQAFWLAIPDNDRTLLFLHGNAGNASLRLSEADGLRRLGVNVLLLEYRGFGHSEGKPHEAGLYADARAAMRYLTEEKRIPENRVVVFGRSLGGAVAVDVAQGRALAGVILESTFSSVADAIDAYLDAPLGWVAGNLFDSASKIENVRSPLLFIHGDQDALILPRVGKRLFDAAPEPKRRYLIKGGQHNVIPIEAAAGYEGEIDRFIRQSAP